MWLWLALGSAILLGFYDVAKKQSLKRNGVMWVLFSVSLFSTILLIPFFKAGSCRDILVILPKAAMVTLSWISGLVGIKLLPLTTASTIKASRPVFVVIFSIIIFSEKLNLWQWAGVAAAFAGLMMLSMSSRREGIYFTRNRGIAWMAVSVLSGVGSALYDKYAISLMEPMFIQSWCNLFITIMMGAVLAARLWKEGPSRERFRWDWTLVLTALLIVIADALYFYSISIDGSLLSIISLLRRFSVIVTFTLGAALFREKNVKAKAVDLAVLLAGIVLLVLGSSL
ncbi:MAG: EamA family transporter [Bacteroidales bacterium]|nr:EamA family transporter [Bacteroidales bacterium]